MADMQRASCLALNLTYVAVFLSICRYLFLCTVCLALMCWPSCTLTCNYGKVRRLSLSISLRQCFSPVCVGVALCLALCCCLLCSRLTALCLACSKAENFIKNGFGSRQQRGSVADAAAEAEADADDLASHTQT